MTVNDSETDAIQPHEKNLELSDVPKVVSGRMTAGAMRQMLFSIWKPRVEHVGCASIVSAFCL